MRLLIIRSFRNLGTELWAWWPKSWLLRRHALALVLLGAVLQCGQYAYDREYWMDEVALEANIIHFSPKDWSKPLTNTQLAPLGFLTAERGLATLKNDPPRWLLRLIPLAAGLSALAAMALLIRDRQAASNLTAGRVSLALLALSPTAIYFASELKPYILDLAAALWAYVMIAALEPESGGQRALRWIGAGLGGAALVWFSFPVAFVLAGVGLVGAAQDLTRRRWSRLAGWVGLSALWLASFAIHWRCARGLLGGSDAMWAFWNFAFPQWPETWEQAAVWPRMVLNLFVNPLGYQGLKSIRLPFLPVVDPLAAESHQGMPLGVSPALALAVIGACSQARERSAWFARLVLPIVLGIAASALRLYPMHGRLAIYALPALLLFLGEGVVVADRQSRRLGRIAFVLLLIEPVWRTIGVVLGQGPIQHGWNSLGDLE